MSIAVPTFFFFFPRKTSKSALLTTLKPLTLWITTNCGTFLKRWNSRPPYLPLRKLYEVQKVTVRTRHGTTDWFKIEKDVHQGCILSPCLFNLYAEYIMRNAGLGSKKHKLESRLPGEKTVINNLRYADDTTRMAEREKELKSLLMKVKE